MSERVSERATSVQAGPAFLAAAGRSTWAVDPEGRGPMSLESLELGGASTADRGRRPRVGSTVRRLATVVFCASLAACGPKAQGKTTPGGTGDTSMKDGETPAGGETGTGTQPGGGDTATAPGPGGENPAEPGEPSPPAIVPPNLDQDPGQAKSAVDEHLKRARAALKKGSLDPEKAISEARAALAIDATSIDAVVILAHANYHKRMYDTAEVMLDMLFKERPKAKDNAGVFYVYGLVYDKINEPQKALVAYKKAVELDPNFGSALVNLGVHQLANKQYGEAVSTYEKVTRDLAIDEPDVWNALGSAYRGRSAEYDPGSPDRDQWLRKAEVAYKRASTLDKNFAPAHYNLGLLYLDADPFPGEGGPMDSLLRLQRAKTYFDEYKNMPGADPKLYEERSKDVSKLIKREEKKRKKMEKEKAAPEK